ncbi:hypothetical protein LPJ64_000917 [Coemansia asiatica]|uniref:UspA domain-containing protein n=1 Tax=Coemansia asiatica TaxID=1052880 RepID=A0A9W7XR36_9FUNG|nr:hypothetical protein LPJ64_000917 [Coemansia asiatica]KAJ2883381.1 hypothetical protein FB639_002188 [Coemansia asiatica]
MDSSTNTHTQQQQQQQQQQDSAGKASPNIFDQLIAQSIDKAQTHGTSPASASAAGISHPQIFRKGTLIEIPDESPSASQDHRARRKRPPERKQRLVAICIKDDAQAQRVVDWALQSELVPKRDTVALIHVRQAANGIIGDLISTNNAKEIAERDRSHGLLRRHAIPIKQDGFDIKGISIRGVDVRGELVRKLIEIKCDLLIVGNHASKSMRDRFLGSKVGYLTENAPCPVLVVGSCTQKTPKDASSGSAQANANTTAAAAAADIVDSVSTDIPHEGSRPELPC